MTPEMKEKRRLTNLRQKAVRDAWKEEKELMEQGRCTRPWTTDEQQELRDTGHIKAALATLPTATTTRRRERFQNSARA